MSSFYDEIATKLDTDNADLISTNEAGRNVFTGVLPAEPNTCVAIFGLPGTNIMAQRDVAELQFPRFQIVTRSNDYEEAGDLLQQVRESLHGLIGYALPTWKILRCHAEQEGGPIGEDKEGRFEFSINFMAEHYKIPEEA